MFFQVIILVLLSIIVTSLSKNKYTSIVIAAIFAIFISLETFSIYIGGSLIDYKFYVHANIQDVWKGKDQFLWQGVLGIFAIFMIIVFIIKMSNQLKKIASKNKKKILLSSSSFIILILLFIFDGSILGNIYDIYKIQTVGKVDFNEALTNLGISPQDYIKPNDLKAKPGKNIIIISMESIERGFLNKGFEKVTPNLQKYSKKYTYFQNMPEDPGSAWTSGSLYTFLTGVPAMFSGNSNGLFQGTTNMRLTSLGNVLEKAGYKSTFLIGEADFSGTRDLVTSNGIKVLDNENLKNKYPKAMWGLYDYDLFTEAKNIIQKKKEPFCLILSTISTHPPHGAIDRRMEIKLPKNLSNYEYTIATLDFLIKDLFLFLKDNNLFYNTSVYIFPDHLLMGLGSDKNIFDRIGENRKLFMISNVDESKFSKSPKEQIYQIDLPKLIIEGAEIQTNAKFLTDYINESDKIAFLDRNISNIVKLNNASLEKKAFTGDIRISIRDKKQLLIKSDGDRIKIDNLDFNKGICREFLFHKDMALVKNESIPFENAFDFDSSKKQFLPLIIQIKDNTIFAYIGDKKKNGYSVEGYNSVIISKERIKGVLQSSEIFDKIAYKENYSNIVANSPNLIKVTSSNWYTRNSNPTSATLNNKPFEYKRGLNIIFHNGNKDKIKSFDTNASNKDAYKFILFINKLIKNKNEFIIFVHDEASQKIKLISDELFCLGFFKLSRLQYRSPYLAYFNNGTIDEYSGKKTITTIFPWNVKINNNSINLTSQKEIKNFAKEKYRFIAHAGGEIEGDRYTNSLEALDLNYKKGFQLFEIDFIKTSDGKFVAAHDWKKWKEQTGYKGEVPITQEEFLKHKIKGKYTPLTLETVNSWFKKHPEAILVTDKVNTPKEFTAQFIDKNRLIMELFSMKAVKEGLSLGIKSAMPSENVLNSIKGDKVKVLRELGIKNIAISRKGIEKNKSLLLKLKKVGIKVYVYHVNFGKQFDEKYVVQNEFKYVYGLYADKWDFNLMDKCN